MEINQALKALKAQNLAVQRGGYRYRFGQPERMKEVFVQTFCTVDRTVKKYQHLPEYDQIIQWMANNEGKGLFLQGDCGRGKSTILTGVLQVLFFQTFGKVLRPFHADDIPGKIKQILNQWAVCIDELGVEPMVNDFGEKYEGFNRIINDAEARIKPVFISTNLSESQILDRYGERTFDRIIRLCKVVKFEGESYRL